MLNTERLKEIEDTKLCSGIGPTPQDACVMQLVSYIADEPWSDHPACTCPVLTAYAIRLNDRFGTDDRQKLKPLIPKLVGTRDGKEKQRAHFLALQSITVFLPILTDALKLTDISSRLREFKIGEWIAARDYINSQLATIRADVTDAYAAAAAVAAVANADAYAYANADAYAYAAAAAYADAERRRRRRPSPSPSPSFADADAYAYAAAAVVAVANADAYAYAARRRRRRQNLK